jgi:hypothetical protein
MVFCVVCFEHPPAVAIVAHAASKFEPENYGALCDGGPAQASESAAPTAYGRWRPMEDFGLYEPTSRGGANGVIGRMLDRILS